MKNDNALISDYLRTNHLHSISIISPHLDDAAFSLTSFITRVDIPELEVYSVFTESDKPDSHWSNAMGFESPAEEFSVRRNEDIQAMNMLNVSFTHAGFEAHSFNAQKAKTIAETILHKKVAEQTLILLPLGAGGQINFLTRLWRRVFKIPTGCEVHQEHVMVRDLLAGLFSDKLVTIGFYAEFPYLWANNKESFPGFLKNIYQRNYECFPIPPDVERKFSIARCYKSQFEAEFGTKEYYQKRTINIPELVFLPVD